MKSKRTASGAVFGLSPCVAALVGCGGGSSGSASAAKAGATDAGGSFRDDGSTGQFGGSTGSFGNDGGGGPSLTGNGASDAAATPPGTILAVIRDFRFYDAGDPSTDPDFENPPAGTGTSANGWDDPDIVTNTLGTDGKPVYKNPAGTTETTHGQAAFDKWYRDTAGTNIHVNYPLPLTANADGSYGYDSEVSGQPYNVAGITGDGFFPIDDGTPYKTPFGNQGEPHNYSFTVEIHTVFVYRGGEYFNFRGDDDVFVYVNGQLVINLGGIHGPEPQQIALDSLHVGLNIGEMYPLDFFSAERHVVGSNIEFETTLDLQPPPK